MARSPVPKQRIFLLYWALILSLGGYLVYDYRTDHYAEIAPVLESSIEQGVRCTESFNSRNKDFIRHNADSYRNEKYEDWRRKAEAASQLVNENQEHIKRLARKGRIQNVEVLDSLAARLNQLGDSLLLFVNRDSTISTDLQALIYQPAAALKTSKMVSFTQYVQLAQVNLYWEDLVWKLELALFPVLDYLNLQYKQEKFVWDYMLNLSTDDRPEVGKPYSGIVEAVPYITNTDNIQFFINGKEYPAKGGKVEFQTIYPKPGTYTNKVEIIRKRPGFNTPYHYPREFEVKVLKP